MAKLTVSNQQILRTVAALKALDRVDDKGKAAFKFGGVLRLALAKKLRRLQTMADDLDQVRRTLLKEGALIGDPATDKPEALARFQEEWNRLMVAKVDVEIGQVKAVDLLAGDANDIPGEALSELAWLCDDMGGEA